MMRSVVIILTVALTTIASIFPSAGPAAHAFSAAAGRPGAVSGSAQGALQTDPALGYLRLVGGSKSEAEPRLAVGGSGNIFLAGITSSPNWPAPWPRRCADPFSATCSHAFLLKMSPDGNRVYYGVVLGGSWVEGVSGLAVDRAGNAYLTGTTSSPDFPTVHPLQARCAGPRGLCMDGFVVKLDPQGRVVYSTYLGGAQEDHPTGIAVDPRGDAYVAGYTYSANFPTVRAMQPHLRGHSDGFVAKIDPSGRRLLYSTYLGGSSEDGASGIAVDRLGQAYISGTTVSPDFRTSRRSFQSRVPGGNCGFFPCEHGFLVKLGTAGRFLAGTFVGTPSGEVVNAVALDASGDAYVVGTTRSTGIPGSTVVGPGDKTLCGANGDMSPCNSAFATELTPWLDHKVYGLVLSGNGEDSAGAVAVDGQGQAVIGGSTYSSDFPTVNPIQAHSGGGECPVGRGGSSSCDGFVAAIVPQGRAVTFSTYLGGDGQDEVDSLALDRRGSVLVAGFTSSTTLAPGVSRPRSAGTIFLGRIDGVLAGR